MKNEQKDCNEKPDLKGNAHKKELNTETSSVQVNLGQRKTPTNKCWSFKYIENSKKLIS